jgi:hypothetical protein
VARCSFLIQLVPVVRYIFLMRHLEHERGTVTPAGANEAASVADRSASGSV